jgi:hypothetical protein
MTEAKLLALRGRLVALRGDLLERLSKEIGAGEIRLIGHVQAAIIACDECRDAMKGGPDNG